MLIENVEMFVDKDTFAPKARVTLILDIESLMDATAVLPREQLAEMFLSKWETAYADYKKKMIGE
jgi:hypothetical protein